MMTPDERDEALAAAARLEESMGDLTGEIGALRNYGHRNRSLIRWLAVSLCLDVILSVALGIVALQANSASNRATEATSQAVQNKANARITCEVANASRAAQISLWIYVLDASDQNPELTASQRAQLKGLRTYVGQVFAQRDCNDPSAPPTVPTPPIVTR